MRGLRHDAGAILWEALVAVTVTAWIVTLTLQIMGSVAGWGLRTEAQAEVRASWLSASRIFAEDIHAANQASVSSSMLTLVESTGVTYRYAVNTSGQLVRVGSSGGTVVLAVGVARLSASVNDGMVEVSVLFVDNSVENGQWATLARVLSAM